jgi:hypothetical protein
VLGERVQTTAGKWITHPPPRCPNGHPLGSGAVLVGHQACLGHGGGHTTWTCRTCDATVYGPPLNTHCTCLDGPATVRISTARGWLADGGTGKEQATPDCRREGPGEGLASPGT